MKQIFQAAFKSKKHLSLLFFAMVSLIFMTIANQMEMFSLGLMTNTGGDFFTLFEPERKSDDPRIGSVSFEEMKERWKEIDVKNKGVITRKESGDFLAKKPEENPLKWFMLKLKNQFDLSSNIKALIFVLFVVAIFKGFWLFVSRYLTQLVSVRISRDLRQRYFEHIQKLSMSFFQKYNLGVLSSRVVGDASQIASSINSSLVNFIQTPFTVLFTLGTCFYLSWKLSLVIFFGLPGIIIPILILAGKVRKVSRRLQGNQEKFTTVLLDFISGVQTVKVFGMEETICDKYREQNEEMGRLEAKTAKYTMLTRPILHATSTVCLAVALIVGQYSLSMSLSQLLVFCALLHLLYEPIKKFADENGNIQRGIIAAERMFEVLNIEPEIQDDKDALTLTSFEDKIEFDHVWFKYNDEWVLEDLSFTVNKGQTVALVGPTGAGKSTIVQLLPRLFEATRGQIRIDGKPLSAYTQKSVRKAISFVAQRPFLFLDTIAANICFGQDFSEEEVRSAAKRAYADEFISQLPEGYNTKLIDAGQNLSGGQQQRLAIARALVKKAPILVLDEATSALDGLSENRIKEALGGLKGEITQVIIAHRLGTIEHADKIIYLEKGRKVAEGTKEELLVSCPGFAKMWQAHYSGSFQKEERDPVFI